MPLLPNAVYIPLYLNSLFFFILLFLCLFSFPSSSYFLFSFLFSWDYFLLGQSFISFFFSSSAFVPQHSLFSSFFHFFLNFLSPSLPRTPNPHCLWFFKILSPFLFFSEFFLSPKIFFFATPPYFLSFILRAWSTDLLAHK